MTYPSYRHLLESGELRHRIDTARQVLAGCTLCPRQCGVDRLAGNLGVCQTGERAVVADFAPHFGEERPLVGEGGSGTIFFAQCNLRCLFCQNYEISHHGLGSRVTDLQLADMMLHLQKQGCHNINFVTPTHVVPQILAALPVAIKRGLNVPLVYNSSGYETLETLQLLDGIIDIYMPDFKFWKSESARLYMNAPDYPERTRMAIQEMHRQVGDLCLDEKGLAQRGLLIRHLVMPGMLDETEGILNFIAREISSDSYVNLMDQYHPCGDAGNFLTSIDLSPLRSINRRWRMQAMPESPDLTKEIFRIYYNVYT